MRTALIQNHTNPVIKTQELLKKGSLHLASGTAFFYYLNHRISGDLDFFTSRKFDSTGFKVVFTGLKVLECAEDSIHFIIEKVKAFTYLQDAHSQPDLKPSKPVE